MYLGIDIVPPPHHRHAEDAAGRGCVYLATRSPSLWSCRGRRGLCWRCRESRPGCSPARACAGAPARPRWTEPRPAAWTRSGPRLTWMNPQSSPGAEKCYTWINIIRTLAIKRPGKCNDSYKNSVMARAGASRCAAPIPASHISRSAARGHSAI